MEYVAPPQIQNPDILGAYIRGRAAPGALELQQQQVNEGRIAEQEAPLRLDMLRQQLGIQQYYFDKAQHEGDQGGGSDQGAPAAPDSSNDTWGPGAILGHSVPKSTLTNQALGDLSVAMGKEDPLSASLKASQADQAALSNRKELLATKMLDPTQPNNGIPFAIQLANMPSGNAQALKNNPAFLQQWEAHAKSAGVNPADIYGAPDVADYAVKRVAYATAMPALQAVGKESLIKAPEHFTGKTNAYGEPIQVSDTTGEGKAAPGYTAPGYSTVDITNPDGSTYKRRVQTSGSFGGGGGGGGGGAPRGGASQGAAPSTGGANQPGDIYTGVKPADDAAKKSAEFAGYMKSGLAGIEKLEAQGFSLSPKARAIIIDAVTAEGDGITHQYLKQLAMKKGLSENDQTYMSAIMPVLQAAGHSMAGARMTTGQMKANFESLIPVTSGNAEALAQIKQNRQEYYKGLLTQAGSAVQLPQYKNLADDLKQMQDASRSSQGSKGPKAGDVIRGYKFIGGDPAKQSSWQKQ